MQEKFENWKLSLPMHGPCALLKDNMEIKTIIFFCYNIKGKTIFEIQSISLIEDSD
jgi:hypothetical protein